MGDIVCTESVKAEMERMWAALGISIEGCADVRTDDGEIFISQRTEAGESRYEVVHAGDGYDVYEWTSENGGMCQCRIFSHHLTEDAVENAKDIYSGILWERSFCVYTDYSGGEDRLCVPIR